MLPRPRYWTAEVRTIGALHHYSSYILCTLEQEREHQKCLLEKGLKAPLLWYRGWVNGINNADDASKSHCFLGDVPMFDVLL